jgi:hypothetical protein
LADAQARVAASPDTSKAGGTKRIRLRIDVPGYLPHEASRLAQMLAVPLADPPEELGTSPMPKDFAENVFMEITRRDDIGGDLLAPVTARGGVGTASYALVPHVQPRDIVIHYDSRQEAIIAVSVAASFAEPAPIFWVSRGGYARRAGARPRWLQGLRVALDHYQRLDTPVTLTDIRAHRDALLELRDQMQARAGGHPIYFPWIPYRETLRTFQSYLVKMPDEAILLFPQLEKAVTEARTRMLVPVSPVQQVEKAVDDAAGKVARRGRGQGFQVDQEAKVAVEAYAMNMATEFYNGEAWSVEDVHGRESYDLVCRRGGEVRRVEVKGTATDGAEVILTPNEVSHARENPNIALFVLSNVRVERAEDGTVTATGGVAHRYDPWHLAEGTLTPIGFRYQVPTKATGNA